MLPDLNKPRTGRTGRGVVVYVTVGDDGKAVLSRRPPIVRRIAGTGGRRGLYPEPGELIWVPGQCLEGIDWVMGRLPVPCEPMRCRLTLEPLEGEED